MVHHVGNTKACPHCSAPMVHRVRKSGPDAGKAAGWYCQPCETRRQARRRQETPERALDSTLWTLYRIRLADLWRMFAEQGGRCKACRAPGVPGAGIDGTGLVLDHDHACCDGTRDRWGKGGHGKRICGACIRGLLCPSCNVALGMVDDSIPRLLALIEYLGHGITRPGPSPIPGPLLAMPRASVALVPAAP